MGTNGGGFFNANSAHPFENPTPFTQLFEMFSIFAISAGLTYTLGRMTGSQTSWMGGVVGHGDSVSDGRDRGLLGGGYAAIRCWRASTSMSAACSPAEIWKAKKFASALRIPRCLPP